MSHFFYNDGEINTPFPTKTYKKQLTKLGIVDEYKIKMIQLVTLMINIIADFKSGSISLDALSDIFSHLEKVYEKMPAEKRGKFDEIKDVLFNGSELNFYIRSSSSDKIGTLNEYLSSIMHFYEQRDDIKKNVEEIENECR